MPRVFAIGETVLDIIFENDQPVSACVGGSMLNSAVSLGRMNVPVSMITGYSDDQAGRMTDNFLINNGVDNTLVKKYSDGKTTIALAFLDDAKKASYQFYQNRPSDEGSLLLPDFAPGDLLLFGSVFSLRPAMRPFFARMFESAAMSGICSVYDPNFRKAHLNELQAYMPAILDNMSNATIVRGSDEDFENIFALSDPDEVYKMVKQYCQNLIVTKGPDDVILYTAGFKKRYSIPPVKVISTIGAGDSFNAGLLRGLLLFGSADRELINFNEHNWDEIVNLGISCATTVCRSSMNYVPPGFIPGSTID
jgi:fructokinase